MSKSVTIIDYGSGNLRSVAKAFERSVAESGSGTRVVVTSDVKQVQVADRIVLPGVGAFGDCMAGLSGIDGMIETLNEAVIKGGRPFIGICVGMQLLASEGHEYGIHKGLGWIPGRVEIIKPLDASLKVPHMGWNTLKVSHDHAVFEGLATEGSDPHVYFVHSNHYVTENTLHRLAVTEYGSEITAVIGRDNILGTQFHPEKSQASGLKLISNFLKWNP
ncbi:MAG: imidazole glycerol phosphate synthase subunit HisH [Rhodospirillales bacterium]|jgi:imidazole glycerol-phosphate synthase subunit HisH|nr:imidazole glycerol phosphate synthase subunit HisH [Rhodospirillales bacterium]